MTSNRLWFGPIAVLIFLAGIFIIGLMTPGYSHIRQTVSELGEMGSPGQLAFSTLLCLVAVCLIVYASAVVRSLHDLGCLGLPAYFIGAMAISCAGVGIFAFPHPLHNVFGLSETIGLQAPLIAVLVCKAKPRMKQVTLFSIIMYAVVLLALTINLIPLFHPASRLLIKPFFGIVQRFLFASWFIWCAGSAVLLMRVGRSNNSSKQTAVGEV